MRITRLAALMATGYDLFPYMLAHALIENEVLAPEPDGQALLPTLPGIFDDAPVDHIDLAKTLVKSFTTYLNVSPLKPHPYPEYGSPLSLAEGVFSRNLCLTRLIKGPLCYGETLIQNNLQEALALSGQETTVQGIPCPQRVVEVSQAYFEAICSFFKSHGELFQNSH